MENIKNGVVAHPVKDPEGVANDRDDTYLRALCNSRCSLGDTANAGDNICLAVARWI